MPYLAPYRLNLAAIALLSLVSTGIGLLVPLAGKFAIDEIIAKGRSDLLAPAALGALIVGLVGVAIRNGGAALHAWTTAKVLFDVRAALIRHLMRLPLPYFARTKAGDLLSRMTSDVAEAQSSLTDGMLNLVMAVLAATTSGIALFVLSWKLGLVAALFGPALWVMVRWLRPRALLLARQMREQTGEAMSFLAETLGGMAEIQAFGLAERTIERYKTLNAAFLRTLLAYQGSSALAEGLPSIFLGLNSLAVLALGGTLIAHGELTWGGLIAFLAYQWRFHGPLRGISALYMRVQRAQVALARVLELFDLPPELRDGGHPLTKIEARAEIRFEGVGFRYPDGTEALSALDLAVSAGGILAIVGPSGSGKSTLVRLLLGLLTPANGTIMIGSRALRDLHGECWRLQVAVVSQETFLFHDTVWENVRLARPDATSADIEHAMEAALLSPILAGLPLGSLTIVGDRGTRLSGGERQRVSLARALLRDPALLILDEATAALDPLTESAVWQAVEARRGVATTLVVTHRMVTAMRADRVVFLDRGRIAEEGRPTELAATGGLFASFVAPIA